MAPRNIEERDNVEIELQPLLCEVNLNVEYAFGQTALRGGGIDRTVKSKWVKLGVSASSEGEGTEIREEKDHPLEAKHIANMCQG